MTDIKKLKKAIKAKCMDCSGGDFSEVAACQVTECPLHPYRMEMQASLLEQPAEDAEADLTRRETAPIKKDNSQFTLI